MDARKACRGMALVLTLTVAAGPAAWAQEAPPAIVVAGFQMHAGPALSNDVLDRMTEQLALHLIESGRFRALDRGWLGVSAGRPLGASGDLEKAARDAAVDYLLVGRVSQYSAAPRYAPLSSPRGLPPAVPLPIALLGMRVLRGRTPPLGIRPPLPQTRVQISVEVIDVRTGRSLMSLSESCNGSGPNERDIDRAIAALGNTLMREL